MTAWNRRPEPTRMTVARSVADILDEHTTLEVECIDRMYLYLYVPILQREAGIAHFWRSHWGRSGLPSAGNAGSRRSLL